MELKWVLIIAAAVVVSFIFAWFLSLRLHKGHIDGNIFIEPTEDGERERIRFVLDLDLDDIKQKRSLTFKVNVNSASQ